MADKWQKLAWMMERLASIKAEINIHADWALVDVSEPPERQAYVKAHNFNMEEIEARAGGLQVCLCYFVEVSNDDGLPRFYLSPDGEPSAVIEVLDDDGATVLDLVAWPLNAPGAFATAVGNADLLGAPNMRGRYPSPLAVHRTPLDWLKADCQGCVVINPEFAGYWFRKWCNREILVEDRPAFQEILQRPRETRTPLPEFPMSRVIAPAQSMGRKAA
jgi:hypothetical protein